MRRQKTRSLPRAFTTAEFRADTLDADARTVEATIYSGAKVPRFPIFDEPHLLELAVSRAAVDLGRINRGVAPLLDSHSHAGVEAVLGRVEQARIEGGEVRARLRFSRRPEVDGVWQDVVDGILGAVSVGVVLHDVEELPRKGAEGQGADMRTFRATRWEVREVSVVPVGADPAARIEASDSERHPCRVTLEGNTMRFKKCPECKAKLETEGEEQLLECQECGADLEELEARRDELARAGRIRELGDHFELGDTWSQQHIRDGSTVQEAAADGRRRRAQSAPNIDGRLTVGHEWDSPGARVEQMADALVARATQQEPSGAGRRYYGETLVACAYEMLRSLGHGQGLDPRLHAGRIIELAHGTSDFPLLLGNVMNKMLLPAYELAQPTYRLIGARKTFNDFREHRFLRRGDFPIPLQVGEGGEITEGTMGENQETVSCLTYARIFNITRQALVNDDLSAFQDLAAAAAQRVADFENATFFSVCITAAAGLGPDLSDGVAVYNSAHSNVNSAGALDVTRIGEARALMMAQTGIDGLKLNVAPRYILVSPASLTLAEQHVATITPPDPDSANPFSGKLVAVGDANLTGTRYYLLADPARLPQYVHGHLNGFDGPRFEVRQGWEVEGIQAKVATDFGCGVIEYRAGVTGAGS